MPSQAADDIPRKYSSSDLSTSSPNFFRAPNQEPFTPTDNLSSLDSDESYVPLPIPIPILNYEPIPIPREPTLEQILQTATGGLAELELARQLRLCVISENISLQLVASYCPLLSSLTLDGSALSSLRDLGCAMVNLRYLDVSRCGLRSLDGTSGLGSVTHLIANNNRIDYLHPATFLEEIQELSVQGNLIRSPYNLRCLALCTKLRTLHMNGNPIEDDHEDMQELGRQLIPQLKFMNGVRIRDELEDGCNDESLGDGSPSSTSESFTSMDGLSLDASVSTPAEQNTTGRPTITHLSGRATSAGGSDSVRSVAQNRPMSACLLRLAKRRRELKDQLISFSVEVDNEFPDRLPQTHVELEFGVLGAVLEKSTEDVASEDTTASGIRLAEQWRRMVLERRGLNGM